MNRVVIGALCCAGILLSILEARRNALGIIALEQLERLFDVVESVLHLA